MSPAAGSCQICGSSLDGLRLADACPGCGFVQGSEYQVVGQSQHSGTALLVVAIGILLLTVAEKPVGRWEPLQLMVLGLSLLGTWCVLRFKRRRAVLWDRGLILIGRRGRIRSCPWQDVEKITCEDGEEAIRFISGDGEELFQVSTAFFGSHNRAMVFVEAARRWLADYGGKAKDG